MDEKNGITKRLLNSVVTDTGKGIEKEFLPRVFEPFKKSGEGRTGLKLAIVQKNIGRSWWLCKNKQQIKCWHTDGKVCEAAIQLKTDRTNLYKKIQSYGIKIENIES